MMWRDTITTDREKIYYHSLAALRSYRVMAVTFFFTWIVMLRVYLLKETMEVI